MECRRIFFEPSCPNNMLFLGNGDSGFRVGRRALIDTEESSKRRPFFSRVEDLCDDEYLDEQLMEKKRRLTPEQVQLLEKSFEADNNKLEPERKTQLAKKLNVQPRQVAVWFQNRRARWKTKQLERDYDQLKSAYDSLLSNYDSMVKENDKLKSELLGLTEKLQPKETTGELGQKYDLVPADAQHMVKVEDRISTGSAGSAVVDDDGRRLLDSGDCMAAVGGINSKEDDGRSYFTNVFAEEQQQEPIDWCIWS